MQSNNYNTHQRKLILNYLIQHQSKHITVDELLFHLKETDASVGKATIYRYFDLLTENGHLRKYAGINGKSACYQYVSEDNSCHSHYHFICESCNQLFHIDCDYIDEINCHLAASHGFQVDSFKTIFHGLCKKCATPSKI